MQKRGTTCRMPSPKTFLKYVTTKRKLCGIQTCTGSQGHNIYSHKHCFKRASPERCSHRIDCQWPVDPLFSVKAGSNSLLPYRSQSSPNLATVHVRGRAQPTPGRVVWGGAVHSVVIFYRGQSQHASYRNGLQPGVPYVSAPYVWGRGGGDRI